jgi:large subunit ribosomal protein L18
MKRLFSKNKIERRAVRHDRIRARVSGTTEIPRLSVFRGLKNMTLQIIDDATGKTLCQATTAEA